MGRRRCVNEPRLSHARWDFRFPVVSDPASILRAVGSRPSSSWDREADLQRIRETYAGYTRMHRERLWDRASTGYARLVDDLNAALERELRDAISDTPEATVVDLGCGTGELAAVGALMVDRWIGVDLRADAVAVARANYPGSQFVEASADAVPLEAGTVDVVVARVLFSSLPSASSPRSTPWRSGTTTWSSPASRAGRGSTSAWT